MKDKLFKRILGILLLTLIFMCSNYAYAKDFNNMQNKVSIQKDYEQAHEVLLAALFSDAAYHSFDKSISKRYLSDYGWKLESFEVSNKKPELVASLDLSTKKGKENKNLMVLAIKGTSSFNDWRRDFLLGSESFDLYNETANWKNRVMTKEFILNANVRHTYLEYLKALVTIKKGNVLMLDYLVNDLKTHPKKFLIVTGHSAGGAIATIYAELLAGRGVSKKQMKVITFGAPSIGNSVMVKYLGDKIDLLRVVNSADAFTGIVANVLGRFEQFGREKEFKVDAIYEDLQHPIAVYIDYAFKDYKKKKEIAIKAKVINSMNDVKDLSFPKVAIIAKDCSIMKTDSEMPDFIDLAKVEISKIFPNYALVSNFSEARKVGAEYVLVIENGVCPLGKDDKLMLTTQGIYTNRGVNLELSMHSTKMKIRRRIIGASLNNIRKCKDELRRTFSKLVNSKDKMEYNERIY